MKRFLAVLGVLAASLGLAAADAGAQQAARVQLTTSKGPIVIELDAAKAPATVENFLQYVRAGFYDGTIFHRVIPGFMAQGGGYTEKFQEKQTRAPIRNEAAGALKNARGTVAMARTNDPHSATAQFFINVKDNPSLNHGARGPGDAGYAAFGRVVEGMDVVDAIVNAPTGAGGPFRTDVPQTPIVIQKATILSR
jgi:peptidyl-prolyl cis-trans isomerase B (cyclophilin B)